VQVALQINTPSLIQIPIEALIDRRGKAIAAFIKSDNTLTYKELSIHSNDGNTILIKSGLNEGDPIALNLGDTLPEGSRVRVLPPATPNPTPPPTKPNQSRMTTSFLTHGTSEKFND
jgi:hypothetical protein